MHVLSADLDALLSEAPRAVDSFFPGHHKLMEELERRATAIVAQHEVESAAHFLVDVAFLKQPHRVKRDRVLESLLRYKNQIAAALNALHDVDRLDYGAMHVLAGLPWFGLNGGRAFNSAVFRLVRPQSFGIIDWRNLAVITGAPGFDGLVVPPLALDEPSTDQLLSLRGHLKLTQGIYERYNNALRALARRYRKTVAQIDLILWTFSILKSPFPSVGNQQITTQFRLSPADCDLLRRDHEQVASRLVSMYLANLKDIGFVSRERAIEELSSLFLLIRDECELYGPPRVVSACSPSGPAGMTWSIRPRRIGLG
jgi:hypothetical protein